jgi:hypothetical protein
MRQRRCAGIRVHGRTVSNNQKAAVVGSHRRNLQQPAVSASPTATENLANLSTSHRVEESANSLDFNCEGEIYCA